MFYKLYRSYVSFDILRRILSDYFGYDVTYVMNITDIDDKIIKRARQNYLFNQYIQQDHSYNEILFDIKTVFERLQNAMAMTEDNDKRNMLTSLFNKVTLVTKVLEEKLNENIKFTDLIPVS